MDVIREIYYPQTAFLHRTFVQGKRIGLPTMWNIHVPVNTHATSYTFCSREQPTDSSPTFLQSIHRCRRTSLDTDMSGVFAVAMKPTN